jgi:hypothetical protein
MLTSRETLEASQSQFGFDDTVLIGLCAKNTNIETVGSCCLGSLIHHLMAFISDGPAAFPSKRVLSVPEWEQASI